MGSARILLVDNMEDSLKRWGSYLEEEGYKVFTANSSEDAMKEINRRKGLDLAILDMRLREENNPEDYSGLALARQIGDSMPIIMLSETPNWQGVLTALRPGERGNPIAVDFVPKSFTQLEFIAAVRRALRPRVFVVHGHDEEALRAVIDFLRERRVRPIVLRDQPKRGMAIIDAFEEYSNVHFAVALLTPDDVGGKAGSPPGQLRPRARQNVIFELGFFAGKLGREHLAVLYKEEVDIPSDYQGVLYISMADDWREKLARELEAAHIVP
jgi:CheY-like chemotaxis protein